MFVGQTMQLRGCGWDISLHTQCGYVELGMWMYISTYVDMWMWKGSGTLADVSSSSGPWYLRPWPSLVKEREKNCYLNHHIAAYWLCGAGAGMWER